MNSRSGMSMLSSLIAVTSPNSFETLSSRTCAIALTLDAEAGSNAAEHRLFTFCPGPTGDGTLGQMETDAHDTEAPSNETAAAPAAPTLDLAAIEADLADVEVALTRLDAGTYWTCEVTGQPLSDELMAAEPTRRRAPTA